MNKTPILALRFAAPSSLAELSISLEHLNQ